MCVCTYSPRYPGMRKSKRDHIFTCMCVYTYTCVDECVCACVHACGYVRMWRVTRPMGRGVDSLPKHLDIFKGAPRRLPKPLSDWFPVRVCSCPLCIYTVRVCVYTRIYACVCACIHACMHASLYVCMHLLAQVSRHEKDEEGPHLQRVVLDVCIDACVRVNICMHVCLYV